MDVAIVILAAGTGSRMNSHRPKVLFEIGGAPMLWHVVKTAQTVNPSRIIVVAGSQLEVIKDGLRNFGVAPEFVVQKEPLGTADAVASVRQSLRDFSGMLIVLYGDTPLIRTDTLKLLIGKSQSNSALAVLGFETNRENSYGRLILDSDGSLSEIVERRDADNKIQSVNFCNSGVVSGDAELIFNLIDEVETDNNAEEYYLTDIIGIARSRGLFCSAVECTVSEALGVNSRADIVTAESAFQTAARHSAIENGILMPAPDTVFFSFDTVLEPECTIEPNVVFGRNVIIEGGARVRSFSHLEGCIIKSGAVIGPFARIRPNTTVETGARIGNFVEIKESKIGNSSKVSHLSYIGDADIGECTNIGAGTITCNYDGRTKHRTVVGNDTFVGSDTILVAPVEVGDSAMTAAGSVITFDVPVGSMGVARSRQSIIKGFAGRFFASTKRNKSR